MQCPHKLSLHPITSPWLQLRRYLEHMLEADPEAASSQVQLTYWLQQVFVLGSSDGSEYKCFRWGAIPENLLGTACPL